MAVKFDATLELHGKTATGVIVPNEVVECLGTSKKPAVKVTVNGHTYRSSVAFMGGRFMLGISAENRVAANVKAGDNLKIELEIDTEPREVNVPLDLQEALSTNKDAEAVFGKMSYSHKRQHVFAVEAAKTPDTRRRRIEKVISMLTSK